MEHGPIYSKPVRHRNSPWPCNQKCTSTASELLAPTRTFLPSVTGLPERLLGVSVSRWSLPSLHAERLGLERFSSRPPSVGLERFLGFISWGSNHPPNPSQSIRIGVPCSGNFAAPPQLKRFWPPGETLRSPRNSMVHARAKSNNPTTDIEPMDREMEKIFYLPLDKQAILSITIDLERLSW